MGHTLRHGEHCLGDDILQGEVEQKRGRGRPRLKHFDQIIRDMGCVTFREAKKLARDIAEWRRVVALNQSQDCVLNDDDEKLYITFFVFLNFPHIRILNFIKIGLVIFKILRKSTRNKVLMFEAQYVPKASAHFILPK